MTTGGATASAGTAWSVPDPLSTLDVEVEGDTAITVRRHGNPDGPRLVLSHGNGLAIDFYYPFWSLLTDEFDVFVHDLRNHGHNALGPIAAHTLPTLARDQDRVLAAIDEHCGAKPTVGAYHSISALATLLSPSEGAGFAALVLFDPPLRKPGVTHEEYDDAAIRNAAMARLRSERFPTPQDFANRLRLSPNFRSLVPGALDLMAETTLRASEAGDGYELRCPAAYEAQIIEYARIFAVSVDLLSYRCPVKVIGADPTLPYSFLPTLDLSDMVGVDYDFLPEASHFLQLEQPRECVEAMREFLERLGLA